jgi:RNA polymerase sigma-70 factor (ECF subfamily)
VETPGIERLVEEYGERAYQFAFRMTNSQEQARELVQEAFYRVLRNWERYDRSQPLDHWFFSILRHLFVDGVRRFEKLNVVSIDAPAEESGQPYDEILEDQAERLLERLEREESGTAVRRALERLTAEHRAVLMLADVEGLSYEQISVEIGRAHV